MVGPVAGYTPTYNFAKVRYDVVGWSTLEHNNWALLDALLGLIAGLPGVRGTWANSTSYAVGDRVVDSEEGGVYRCVVAHTSAASGTFEADRTANPTYWEIIATVPVNTGNWTTATAYSVADIVAVDTYDYYYCIEAHTAGTFATDLAAGKWTLIWEGTLAVAAAEAAQAAAEAAQSAAEAAKTAAEAAESNAETAQAAAEAAQTGAETAETNATNSALLADNSATDAVIAQAAAASSASAASTSASNAATSASNAATSASTATTQAGIATTKATEAAASAASVNFSGVAADIIPDVNNTRDLGSTSKVWNEVFVTNIRADNFGNRAGTSSISADTVLQGTAKIWANMNGTGTIATRDSFNVSSLTDGGIGFYALNFSSVRPSANYQFSGTISAAVENSSSSARSVVATILNVGAVSFVGCVGAGTALDWDYVHVAINGDPP